MRRNRLLATGIIGLLLSMLGCVTGPRRVARGHRYLGKHGLARLHPATRYGDLLRVGRLRDLIQQTPRSTVLKRRSEGNSHYSRSRGCRKSPRSRKSPCCHRPGAPA